LEATSAKEQEKEEEWRKEEEAPDSPGCSSCEGFPVVQRWQCGRARSWTVALLAGHPCIYSTRA